MGYHQYDTATSLTLSADVTDESWNDEVGRDRKILP